MERDSAEQRCEEGFNFEICGSLLNGCDVGGSRLTQDKMNDSKSFHAVKMLGERNFFKSWNELTGGKIGWWRKERR